MTRLLESRTSRDVRDVAASMEFYGKAAGFTVVEGVDELHERCVAAGATITSTLTCQPLGNYDFVVADPDGHQIAFGEVPAR